MFMFLCVFLHKMVFSDIGSCEFFCDVFLHITHITHFVIVTVIVLTNWTDIFT